jgi:hypothetical protein
LRRKRIEEKKAKEGMKQGEKVKNKLRGTVVVFHIRRNTAKLPCENERRTPKESWRPCVIAFSSI